MLSSMLLSLTLSAAPVDLPQPEQVVAPHVQEVGSKKGSIRIADHPLRCKRVKTCVADTQEAGAKKGTIRIGEKRGSIRIGETRPNRIRIDANALEVGETRTNRIRIGTKCKRGKARC